MSEAVLGSAKRVYSKKFGRPPALPASITPAVSVAAFKINPLIDIVAPALLDMISDKPIGRPHDKKRKAATSAPKIAEVERNLNSVESVDWQW